MLTYMCALCSNGGVQGGFRPLIFGGIYIYTHIPMTNCSLRQAARDKMAKDPYKIAKHLYGVYPDGFTRQEYYKEFEKAGYGSKRQMYWFSEQLKSNTVAKLIDDETGRQRCNNRSEPLYISLALP